MAQQGVYAIVYFAEVIAASVVRGVCTHRFGRRPDDRGPLLERWIMLLAFLAMFVLPLIYALTSWLVWADYRLPIWMGMIGAVLFGIGIWLLWRSHVDLEHAWSAVAEIQQGQRLVMEGVYRHVRHPMYSAHLLWGLGQVLLLQNWVAGPAMLFAQALLLLVRVPREERLLLVEFGDAYRAYMGRTGRFTPRLRPPPNGKNRLSF